MNKIWIRSTLGLSLLLLTLLKTHEVAALKTFYMAPKTIKLQPFIDATKNLKGSDLEALGIWESILTGKSKFLGKETKKKYQKLGLLHLFTPSGFHLSAMLFPLMSVIYSQRIRLFTLLSIGASLIFVPGFSALKRMLTIKVGQNLFGQKTGFIFGIVSDMLFGSFQRSALSFSYSFLFLGIIYSKVRGLGLIIWFFIGQLIITYFQGGEISFLLIFLSPFINFLYGLILPIIFISSYPLLEFQLKVGVALIRLVSFPVDFSYFLTTKFPAMEIGLMTLLLIFFCMCKRWKEALIIFILQSGNLNSNFERAPGLGSNEFVSRGKIIKRVYDEKKVRIYFTDGRCDLKLIRGFWWESCSPRKRSS